MNRPDFDKIKQSYDRDGFVVLRGYLEPGEVDELKERAVPLAAALLAKVDNKGRFRNLLKSLQREDQWFKRELEDGKHVELIRFLLGDGVEGASAAWFDRPEGESQGIEPHVDAWGGNASEYIGATIWIALDPTSADNGCLYYLRGSHQNVYPQEIPIPGIDTESDDAFAAELEPGDAVIHNAMTVHWSGGNSVGKPRRAVTFFYHVPEQWEQER